MKIEELREIAKARTPGKWPCWSDADIARQITLDGLLRPAVAPSDAEFIATMANHIDSLIDVAASAKAACFSPALLSDKTAMIMRMGDLHAAIAKLEAIDV